LHLDFELSNLLLLLWVCLCMWLVFFAAFRTLSLFCVLNVLITMYLGLFFFGSDS
jgi:hypothetical protein